MTNRPTGPAEGEALRRLIEKWRKVEEAMDTERYDADNPFAPDVRRRSYCDGKRIGFKSCADELEAALAPLSGPVDASGEPRVLGYRAPITSAPYCLDCIEKHRPWKPQATPPVYDTHETCIQCGKSLRAAAAVPSPPAQPLPEWLHDRCWTCGEAENHGWHRPMKVRGPGINPSDFHAFVPIQGAALPPSSPVADSPTCTAATDFLAAGYDLGLMAVAMEQWAQSIRDNMHDSNALTAIAVDLDVNAAALANADAVLSGKASAPSPSAGAAKEQKP